MKQHAFPRTEHLKSRKQIQTLFHSGKAFSVFPFRIVYLPADAPVSGPARAGFTVSSRHFKKAVDRNRIKRLMREAYRLQKNSLSDFLSGNQMGISLFFIYTDRKLPDYSFLYKKMGIALNSLIKVLQNRQAEDEKIK